jgi:2-keto-4-pentenoate hydratase/2-oxohepta-3-ene-1,7-dioic acid hydratase in catechol pathway
MVFGGKVYETDGANAIGVYEAELVRPLSPVPQAPSLRIFPSELPPLTRSPGEPAEPQYFYGNPSAVVGTNQLIAIPDFSPRLAVHPYLAAVIVTPGYRVDIEQADDMVLGLTLLNLLVAPEVQAQEVRSGGGFGRSIDIGAVLGPVLTTPDELDDLLVDQEFGRCYRLTAVARVNGVEKERGNVEDLPFTVAEAIAAASRSCTVREGDVFALGPLIDLEEPILLEAGDEFQLSIENLGALSFKLTEDL